MIYFCLKHYAITLHIRIFVANLTYILHTSESFYQMDVHGCLPMPLNVWRASYITQHQGLYYPFKAVTIIPARIYHSQDPLTSCYYHPVLSVIVITAISKHTIVQVNIS